MDSLDVATTIERLAALEQFSLNTFVERRRRRPEGAPTRLQEHVLVVARRCGHLAVSEVSALLEVSPPTASQLLGTMEARGWISRTLSPDDRRRHDIALTPAGQAVVAQAEARRRARFERVVAALDGTERAQLVALAERLVQILAGQAADGEGGL
jgi:DNA-binding MarR family transcriptional regulator